MNDKYNKLKILQALSLDEKILLANRRIEEWYYHHDGNVYVSFSGGKDSTVLLHLVRALFPEVPAVFFNTGLEFPEIVDFVKSVDNVEHIRPKMTFKEVVEKYGYPVISKEQAKYISEARNTNSKKLRDLRINGRKIASGRTQGKISEKWKFLLDAPFKISDKCCDVMKKRPAKKYEKTSGNFPFLGVMSEDSSLRNQSYKEHGCNAFDMVRPISRPMMTWVEKDVWDYIKKFNLKYSKIYNMGYKRTGCVFCMFGCHRNNPNRFQRLQRTHPKLWNYCINKLGLKEILEYINVPYEELTNKQIEMF